MLICYCYSLTRLSLFLPLFRSFTRLSDCLPVTDHRPDYQPLVEACLITQPNAHLSDYSTICQTTACLTDLPFVIRPVPCYPSSTHPAPSSQRPSATMLTWGPVEPFCFNALLFLSNTTDYSRIAYRGRDHQSPNVSSPARGLR